jgi:hypothetical protein
MPGSAPALDERRDLVSAGYYPGLGSFQLEQSDPNYATTLLDALAANGINYMRNVFTMGQPYGDSPVPYRRTGPGLANDQKPKLI